MQRYVLVAFVLCLLRWKGLPLVCFARGIVVGWRERGEEEMCKAMGLVVKYPCCDAIAHGSSYARCLLALSLPHFSFPLLDLY
jgi:hypothetical protein